MRRAGALLLALAPSCAPEVDSGDPWWRDAPPPPFTAEEVEKILTFSPLEPPPADSTNRVADDETAARVGQAVFFDERFSRHGDFACATCHVPEKGFADGRALAEGREQLARHTPSLLNVAYNRWFFWDGRADSLWAQALEPLENPLEHGGSRLQYAHIVYHDAALRPAFERLFGPMFEPLRDSELFRQVSIDEFGAVCWPNGADLAPDGLYESLVGTAGSRR